MKNRNPIAVALLPLVTFGIYSIYWQVKTKGELNQKGASIPTAWLIIIPFVNIWWLWKYSEGVEQVTGEKLSAVLAFILLWLLGSIGAAIVQHTYNQLGDVPAVSSVTENNSVPQQTPATPAPAPTVQPAEPTAGPVAQPDTTVPTESAASDDSTNQPPASA